MAEAASRSVLYRDGSRPSASQRSATADTSNGSRSSNVRTSVVIVSAIGFLLDTSAPPSPSAPEPLPAGPRPRPRASVPRAAPSGGMRVIIITAGAGIANSTDRLGEGLGQRLARPGGLAGPAAE